MQLSSEMVQENGYLKISILLQGRNLLWRPDQLWNADITYIRITSGFVYLAAILDGFSRKIVGYGLGKTLSPILAIEALNDAISKRNIKCLC